MCMELLYENSAANGSAKFEYLAVEDKVLVNEYTTESWEDNTQIWAKFELDNKPVITLLINYDDVEYNWENKDKFDWFTETLQGQLTALSNDKELSALSDNIISMISDAIETSNLSEEDIKLFLITFNKANMIFSRPADFQMHNPATEDTIHLSYDT